LFLLAAGVGVVPLQLQLLVEVLAVVVLMAALLVLVVQAILHL
jgi:hypothetical protein